MRSDGDVMHNTTYAGWPLVGVVRLLDDGPVIPLYPGTYNR